MSQEICEVCGKQAIFMCGECKWTAYCSREHQLQNWPVHKKHCNIINSYRLRQQEQQINKIRKELRKKYLQNYMHKVYDSCIKTAEQMVYQQSKHIKLTRQIFNQMQYGISICLLCKSWLNIRNIPKASIIIKGYLEQKMHFLKDMRDIVNFQSISNQERTFVSQTQQNLDNMMSKKASKQDQNQSSKVYNDKSLILENPKQKTSNAHTATHSIIKQFAIKKVSLIASIAHILYCINQPVVKIYEIYTQHIEKMFGFESLQVSNCYFMMGSYFMERKQYYKSIASFMRASELRGNMAGDCYYNLGILFKILKKSNVSIAMFQDAARLREYEFGQNSSEVADVYHNLALINQSEGNFKSAIENLQKIALIYSKDKGSAQYKNAVESIKILEEAFRKHMEKQPPGGLSAGILGDIKKTLRKVSKVPDDGLSQHSFMSDLEQAEIFSSSNNFLKINDDFLKRLNAQQCLYLSELQSELGRTTSIYMAANAVGQSKFLRVLKVNKLQSLMKDNEMLFKHISIQQLSKRDGKQYLHND